MAENDGVEADQPLACLAVGGGPAGLMAAEQVARSGHRVVLAEARPNLGRKLLLAGRSGLNLTHSEPLADFAGRYRPPNIPKIYKSLEAFGPQDLCAFSEGLGQPTMRGSSGRIFPEAWHATGFLRAWLARLRDLSVEARVRHRLIDLERQETGPWLATFEAPQGRQRVLAKTVILALGGASWPRVGSQGEWAAVLERLGCRLLPFAPSNCGLKRGWSPYFADRFAGAYWKGVQLRLLDDQGTPLAGPSSGDVTLTAQGLESGAVYPISALAFDGAILEIDFRPQASRQHLASDIARLRPRASLTKKAQALKLPASFVPLLKEAPQVSPELTDWVKAFRLPLAGQMDLARAISSQGGLALNELDEAFQLTRAPGLYAVGEMLAWDAPTGGYLLQACFSQGFVAGQAVAQALDLGEAAGP